MKKGTVWRMLELSKDYGLYMTEEKVEQLISGLEGADKEVCAAVLNIIAASVRALDRLITQ